MPPTGDEVEVNAVEKAERGQLATSTRQTDRDAVPLDYVRVGVVSCAGVSVWPVELYNGYKTCLLYTSDAADE